MNVLLKRWHDPGRVAMHDSASSTESAGRRRREVSAVPGRLELCGADQHARPPCRILQDCKATADRFLREADRTGPGLRLVRIDAVAPVVPERHPDRPLCVSTFKMQTLCCKECIHERYLISQRHFR